MILIFSDYHTNEEAVLELIEKYKPSHILCCGDGESANSFYLENNIVSVKGNCDYASLPLVKRVVVDDMKIVMVHGHLHNVYFDTYRLYLLALENECDYVLFGHTHKPYFEEYEGVKIINPGALKEGNYALIDNGEVIFK